MAKNSKIDWTDHSWNPWHGCRRVSPGCDHCYMYRDKRRFGQQPTNIVRSGKTTFTAPLRWRNPAKIFACSWSDFFIPDADPWRDEAWDIIRRTPHHTYQLLTKRPAHIIDRLPEDWPLPNVWLGVTVENQEMADVRIPLLLSIPAVLRFVSIEPMLGPVGLRPEWLEVKSEGQYMNIVECDHGLIGWVICGGETGPQARYMEPEWAREIKKACARTDIPFFMKQMTGKKPIPAHLHSREFPLGR